MRFEGHDRKEEEMEKWINGGYSKGNVEKREKDRTGRTVEKDGMKNKGGRGQNRMGRISESRKDMRGRK
jgi:hypothetical protein